MTDIHTQLYVRLENDRRALLSANVLQMLGNSAISSYTIYDILYQYAYYGEFIPKALCLMASRLPNDEDRLPPIRNSGHRQHPWCG
jgi:hypothetical protein